ncbi:hypothetical protein ESCO_000364 [Escovopsis weberi]|uniref:Uncharacterized protein n=1 Tax=Escovopsis weberi TaxID=150374 RepID=A0A0M8N385_ESCWE|nr:hypothetical protein ESCO_000364 [Escovopsis weberi]
MHSDRPVYDMELPFDPNTLTQRARDMGFGRLDAAVFAHVALEKVREIAGRNQGQPVSALEIAEAIKAHAAAEIERREEEEEEEERKRRAVEQAGVTIWDEMQMDLDFDADPVELLKDLTKVVAVDEDAHEMRVKRFEFSDEAKDEFFDGQDPYAFAPDLLDPPPPTMTTTAAAAAAAAALPPRQDLISNMCQNIELAVELGKHLHARDILNLYKANKAFYHAVNSYLMSSVRSWVTHHCPDAARVFNFKLYKRHLAVDPVGRTWGEQARDRPAASSSPSSSAAAADAPQVRAVPGLRYLQLVMGRDKYCREMIAILARNGHPLPRTMHRTLLRLWLLMELATSLQREALLRNRELWADGDLYNAQLFFMKLGLHFNDPVYGPSSWDLLHLMMGQKGLYPLWQLLARKRFKTLPELLALRVRYDLQVPPDHWGESFFDRAIHGVPFHQVGVGHLEGWGLGENHLLRPDELIPMEAVARGLELDRHLTHMMLWGLFDWDTGDNYVPGPRDMYISDEDDVLGDADTSHHWTAKHVLKKHFPHLPPALQSDIIEDDEDQRLRAMAWCGDNIDDYESVDEEEEEDEGGENAHRGRDVYTLDDEINRGFIVPHQDKNHISQVPPLSDKAEWIDFVSEALIGAVPDLSPDERLRTESWNNYQPCELGGGGGADWDWAAWLRQHEHDRRAASSSAGTTTTTTTGQDSSLSLSLSLSADTHSHSQGGGPAGYENINYVGAFEGPTSPGAVFDHGVNYLPMEE